MGTKRLQNGPLYRQAKGGKAFLFTSKVLQASFGAIKSWLGGIISKHLGHIASHAVYRATLSSNFRLPVGKWEVCNWPGRRRTTNWDSWASCMVWWRLSLLPCLTALYCLNLRVIGICVVWWCGQDFKKEFWARFPHSPILHYSYSAKIKKTMVKAMIAWPTAALFYYRMGLYGNLSDLCFNPI